MNTTKQWTLVEIDGETITCTPGHKFFLPENKKRRDIGQKQEHAVYETLSEKWVRAIDLKSGDIVLLENGKYGTINNITIQELETPETTYNFEVADYHTYYVGEKGILTHNTGNCSVNQMNKQIDRGQAPKGVDRIDIPKVKGEQIHAHLNKGSAINIDGTLKHGTGEEMTKAIAGWLKSYGWKL